MATYYVHKGVGSDSNTGTSWATAFASLGKANSRVAAGDTVYVRQGATPYQEILNINANNTRWLADAGHQPVIDGKYHDGLSDFNISDKPAGTYVVMRTVDNMFPSIARINADGVLIEGFKICNVAGRAMTITGSRNIVRNCWMDFTYTSVCSVNGGGAPADCADNLIEDCLITRGSVGVYAPRDVAAFGRPWDMILATRNSLRTVFRRCTVHHCFAEGIVLDRDSVDGVIEFCESYNNMHMNFYLNNAQRPTIRFCKGWSTGNPEMLRGGEWASEPLVITEEVKKTDGKAIGQKVYGCIFVGGRYVVTLARVGTKQDTQLKGGYFGYNTLVGLPGITQFVLSAGTKEPHEGTIVENNIFYAPAGVGIFHRPTDPMTGVKGRGNVIHKVGTTVSVPNWLNGEGTIVADPKLSNPAATIIDRGGALTGDGETGTHTFDQNNYKLTGASPGINKAITSYPFNGHSGVELARQRDYFGATRTQPDIGAHEYGGVLTNSVVASFSRSPAATTVTVGATVAFTNSSFTTGTATITGQTWTVRKSGTVVATAATTHYSYTFNSVGDYSVELAVTATGGLSDTETVGYTVVPAGGGVVVTAAFSAAPPQTTIPQGYTIAFTDQSTVQNGTQASRAWAVLAMPGGTVVATGTTTIYFYQFNTAGSFRVRLTATATTGESDTETLDYTVTSVTTPTVTANFTASDADLLIDEGGSITFTNTSTVANTTISGYVWTVTALSGGGEQTYTTTNVTHTFAQAGLYRVRLLANTAAGVSDAHEVTVTVRGQTEAGMVFMAAPVRFAANTGTGTQTVTAAALGTMVPKGVHIRLVGGTTANTAAADALWSEGAGDGVSQWVHARFSKSAQAAGTSWRRYAKDAIMLSLDATGAVNGRAALVKFVAGGMELNVSDGFPAGYLAEATFYAGNDCQFWADTVTVGGLDVAVPVDVGFEPAAVYAAGCWATQEDVTAQRAELSLGWATAAGQYSLRNEDRHGSDPTFARTRLDSKIATTIQGGGAAQGVLAFVEAGDFGASGLTLTARKKAINLPLSLFAFSTGGAGVQLLLTALSTSSPSVHALAYDAQTVMALTSTTLTEATVDGAQAQGVGAATRSMHGDYSGSVSIAAADAAASSSTYSLAADGWRQVSSTGTNLASGTMAMDADSLDITWATAPALAYKAIFLVVEKAEVIVADTKPVADFTQEIDYGDGNTGLVVGWFDAAVSNGRGYTITSYLWDFGDGATSTEAAPNHVYRFPGAYDVTLTVTTSQGSDTIVKTALVQYVEPDDTVTLVGLSQPLTSGGQTDNAVRTDEDEDGDSDLHGHTHAIQFLPYAKFEALDEAGVATFLAQEADPAFALVVWDDAGNRLLVKKPDGSHRAVGTTAV